MDTNILFHIGIHIRFRDHKGFWWTMTKIIQVLYVIRTITH